VNLFDLIGTLGLAAEPLKVELLDATFRYDLPRFDQTLTPVGESAIEFVIRKRLVTEIEAGGRLPNNADLMTAEEFHSLTGIPIR
jgi:hypothetical protein